MHHPAEQRGSRRSQGRAGAGGLVCLLAFATFSAPMAARAQEDARDAQAQTHFRSGTLYFDRGEYEHAAREFRAAYELSGRVPLLYNLYLAHERLGEHAQAAEALAAFLEGVTEVPNRASLEARLVTLERRAAQRAAGEAPEPAEEELDEEPDEDRPSRLLPLPAWIAFGVGAAGLATLAVAGGLALSEDRSLASSCGADAGRTCTSEDLARLNRRTTAADVGLGLGVAGAVTGLVLWLVLRDRRTEERPSTAWGPWLPPGGAGLSAQGRF